MPLVCASAMSDFLFSPPQPFGLFLFQCPGKRRLSGFAGEPQKHPSSTSPSLTRWSASSPDRLESCASFSLALHLPLLLCQCTRLLRQDGGPSGNVRLSGLESLSHAWRFTIGGPYDRMDRLPPPPTTRKCDDVRLELPHLCLHLVSLLRQNSLRELFYGLCSQKQRNPKSVFPGLATKSQRKKPGFVMVYLISAGNS